MLSPASEAVASIRASHESLSSNPDSPGSPLKPRTLVVTGPGQDVDIDMSLKSFAGDLLECGLKEERFRIDRKKLEDMLQIQSEGTNAPTENAEIFFQRVMKNTGTLISWPSKLKIGAKSKKDPHVKIVGVPEAVLLAKAMILEILDTKKNRVTLKMDVSHTDHSYIIGKGGFKIQQVMEETGCHIHFPDSNRNNSAEKSNQVSIAGQASGVELARSKIRDLLPLVFMFELPNGETRNPGEESSPAIQHIQQTYSFNVAFRSIGPGGMGRTLVVVRGCQRLLSRLRQGLSLLMQYLTGSETIPVMGFMKTEIAAQHHQFVMGACNVNTQMIMNKTGANIIFPDPAAFGPESPTQAGSVIAGHSTVRSKSTVIIHGSFDSVCLAWQELLKCLPLVLMFDLKEGYELDSVMVNNFMESFNINIMVRPKIKDNTKSVLIRGAEKDCKILFQVRKEILGLDDDDFGTISSPAKSSSFRAQTASFQASQLDKDAVQITAQNMTTAESLSLLTNIIQQNPQIVGLLNNLSTVIPTIHAQEVIPPPPPHNPMLRAGFQGMQQTPMNHYADKRDIENWINRQQYVLPPVANYYTYVHKEHADDGDSGIFIPSRSKSGPEPRSEPSSKPESSASSTSSMDTPDYNTTNSFLKKLSQSNEPSLGHEIHDLLGEYGNKKLSANRAMQQPIGDGARTPSQLWSGYGFSKSMPDYAQRAARRAAQHSGSITEFLDMDNSKTSGMGAAATKSWTADLLDKSESPLDQVPSPFSFSNFWESVPQQPTINYGAINSVDQLLNLLDLEKYVEVFNHHEIDYKTLLTLTDVDLQIIGMSYGARRKMTAAISAIRDHKLEECSLKNFRAAPGAERRTFLASRYASSSNSPDHDEGGSRL